MRASLQSWPIFRSILVILAKIGEFEVNTPKIDQFDRQLLLALRKDGRMSVNDLSRAVGLSPTPVSRRLKNLEESGVIQGYCALIDEVSLGYSISVFISVQLDKQVDEALVTFEAAVQKFPEVVDCWLMTGNRDYLLRIAATSLQEFEKFLVGELTKVPGVASIESSIPLRRIKSDIARTI